MGLKGIMPSENISEGHILHIIPYLCNILEVMTKRNGSVVTRDWECKGQV